MIRNATHLFLPAVILACSCASATAQIPNAGFENWVEEGGHQEPVGWLTYNDIVTTWGPIITVEPGSPGEAGAYYALITSQPIPDAGSVIQGWLSAGTSGEHSGFPCTEQPAALTGQWQYGIEQGDTGQVQVALSRWNSEMNSSEGIAYGSLEVTGSLNEWQLFNVPLTYLSTEAPDTAYIQFVSSISLDSPVAGSFLKVDDLAFSGSVGIGNAAALPKLRLFPSPASNVLHITAPVSGELRIFDSTGRVVLRPTINAQQNTLDVSALAPGLFSYRLLDDRGRPVAGGRWMKQ